jgi:type IV fimbrial biogenesis protein FimT
MENRGLTLIELITVLAISSILGAIAIPAMSTFIQQQRLRTASHDLSHLIKTTRSLAISQHSRVTLWNQDGNWNQGLEVFSDTDGNGLRSSSESVLLRSADHSDISISGNFWVQDYISYIGNGAAVAVSGAFQVGTLTLCQAQQTTAYKLIISVGGRVRIEKTSVTNCP